ncbi:hypothetical protein ACFLSV_05905 [Bacteroidota bacterium]
MIQLIIGGLVLSTIHALIPNHWIPIVAISKSEKWSRREAIEITLIIGSAHTISSIMIGIVIGLIGYRLSETLSFITNIAAPLILVILGIIFVVLNKRHHHHKTIDPKEIIERSKRSKFAIISSLGIAMFFSPCLEVDAYYLTAGTLGWMGITTLSIIYFFVTVFEMIILVNLSMRGIDKLNIKLHFFEHNEKAIAGVVLIVLGIFTYFVKI